MKADHAVTFLRTIPIFHELADDELTTLAKVAQERAFAAGDVIVEPHAKETGLFVLVEGECQAYVEHRGLGFEVELRRFYPGDYFGAEAVLAGENSTASVRALSEGRALVLSTQSVDQLLAGSDQFARTLCRVFAGELQRAIKDHNGIQFIRIQEFPSAKSKCRLIPPRVSSICRSIAVAQEGDCITVAMVNPSDVKARSFIRQVLNDYRVHFVAISEDDFERHGRPLLGETLERNSWNTPFQQMRYQNPQGELRPMGGTSEEDLLSDVLVAAIRSTASDVHFEPYTNGARVRLRVDGRMLSFSEEISALTYRQLAARVKVLAEMDTTRIRRPQDGRFVLFVDDRRLEFRVTVSPCHGGEKIVLRVVAPSKQMGELTNLILNPPLQQLARDLFENPSGLILVTGPSGAGKTTTLYAALNTIFAYDGGISVVTIEDPVEYDLPFATQIQVNRDTGMDFPTILRTVLRQDPDVILVGEIRDRESAAMAAEAATTGHLVLSSLHTYSALEAVVRMRDLQVEPYLLAAGLKGVITQQLVPRLVPGCTEPVSLQDPAVQRLIELGIWNAQTPGTLLRGRHAPDIPIGGEQGRVAVFEMLSVSPELSAAIDTAQSMNEMMTCLDATCFASFGDYARFLLAEGLVAPERIAAVMPTRHTLIRRDPAYAPGRLGVSPEGIHAHAVEDSLESPHALALKDALVHDHAHTLTGPVFEELVDDGNGHDERH
ncbi:MAG: ATPase, T2SS/T4P/T4SS family [Pirellulaceae bacterium]